ncbi:hypothetical protein DSM110093_02651 [Sulfitobacter sp. DSM 110093]|uniref:TRAP transporter small permease n=1 Tax=Sulfitobacter sp. DSM 110093 TaxID=2883127 RepID=UPI001FAB43CA|nr:TRAP transporter small permease [Sulfitobacter sp. DSM 110093]UOA32844.1 hypothetical protein DSM110093_02651 [Sulfitobacter sp. DSM 110093]
MATTTIAKRILIATSELAAIIAALSLLVATGSVLIQIITRYQNNPTLWSIEACQFAVIAMVFIGAATAARERQHFRVDYLATMLHPRWQYGLNVTTKVISACILALLGYFTVDMLSRVMNTYSIAARIPVRFIYYFMIYGVLSWLLVTLLDEVSPPDHDEN